MTHASEFLDFGQLPRLVTEGLITRRQHHEAPAFIYNYSAKCQYSAAWDRTTMACRGLILDQAGNVLARPFPKFFNLEEHNSPVLPPVPVGESFEAFEKVDGSLGIVWRNPLSGRAEVATRGTFTSEQALWASQWLENCGRHVEIPCGQTWCTEIVYPKNRIVVDYGARAELVFLAAIDHATGRDLPWPEQWPGARARRYDIASIDNLLASVDEPDNFEGFVLRYPSTGQRVKVKLDTYVRLHRLMTEVTPRNIWEILAAGGKLDSLLERVPDEFFEWAAGWEARLKREFAAVMAFAWSAMNDPRVNPRDRKATAEYFKGLAYTPVLFRLLDGKDPSTLVWKSLRPTAQRGLRADIDTGAPQEEP